MPDESQLVITGTESRNVIINAVSLSEVALGDGNLRTTSKITKLTVQVGAGGGIILQAGKGETVGPHQ